MIIVLLMYGVFTLVKTFTEPFTWEIVSYETKVTSL
jgi:hypothetical protein